MCLKVTNNSSKRGEIYNTANTNGEVVYRQHVEGEYTRGLPNREVAWKNVTVADAVGPTAAFPAGQKRDFMEGFRYRNDLNSTLKPDFFKEVPPAVVERNLVWGNGMIEMYGPNYFEHLMRNGAYHATPHEDDVMPVRFTAATSCWSGLDDRKETVRIAL